MNPHPLTPIRPSPEQLAGVLRAQSEAAFSYEPVGATRDTLPEGWHVDEQHRVIGHGARAFGEASEALGRWAQFDLSWVWPLRTDVPLEPGAPFGFLAYTFGLWSINVCRIVYVIDDARADQSRRGFAYGTVGAHAVRGEERFLIEWDRQTDAVTFGIRKFSRPAHPLLRLAGPITRWVQRRFTRDALRRLEAEVQT